MDFADTPRMKKTMANIASQESLSKAKKELSSPFAKARGGRIHMGKFGRRPKIKRLARKIY